MSFTLKTMLGVAAIEAALLFLLVFSSNSALSSSLERELEKRAETTLRMLLATAQEPILTDDLATLEDLARCAPCSLSSSRKFSMRDRCSSRTVVAPDFPFVVTLVPVLSLLLEASSDIAARSRASLRPRPFRSRTLAAWA